MKKHLLFLMILVGLSSCKTSSLLIDVLQPARINLPQDIRTIAVVNRSLPASDQEVNNLVEGLISGESILADRFGSKKCIRGFQEALLSSPRFTVVVPEVDLKGTGTDKMPPIMDWTLVGDICRENKADALISLETFDSNTGGRVMSVLMNNPGQNLTVKVETGWRIYHPTAQQILDENIFTDYMDWDRPPGQGNQELVERAGYYAGTQYAARISPSWMTVSRMYFKKGNKDFKEAKRLVGMGMYEEAGLLWEAYTDHKDPKLAGYACYNLALATEIGGDLGKALEWATKAYREYRLKEAARYMNVLNVRIRQAQELDQQLPPE